MNYFFIILIMTMDIDEVLGREIRLVQLDVEDCSKELLRQQSYAIKNQLVALKAPY